MKKRFMATAKDHPFDAVAATRTTEVEGEVKTRQAQVS
jgi:hypothetical protein